MSSNTVLISGPAVGAAQILTWPYSCVFLPPVSTAIRTLLCVSSCGSSQWPFIHSIDRVCLVWSCGFNLQLVQLVWWFWVFFLSHTVPGFQLWLYFHLCTGLFTGVCSWGCPGGLGSTPMRARSGGGAAAWAAGVLAAPGSQGSWRLGQQEL